ncbi:MAG: hypothetical protein QW292_09320 [Candidatus Parvarchaeota archaeon]
MKYWSIPLLFTILFIESGYILFSLFPLLRIDVNGQPMVLLPPNFQYFYNTREGPFSSIFLSNFIYDGIGNLVVLLIYSGVFILDAMLLSEKERTQRAYFLIAGAIFSAFIPTVIIRYFMNYSQISYGQSAIAAGFSGIVMFYLYYDILHGKLFKKLKESTPIRMILLSGLYGIGIADGSVGILAFILFLPPLTIGIHMMALVTGAVLAASFTYLIREKPAGTVFLQGRGGETHG